MKNPWLWIVAAVGVYFVLRPKKPTKLASVTGTTNTAGPQSVLSGILSGTPYNGGQADNTPAYVTAAGGAFSALTAGLKNLFSTPSGVSAPGSSPAAATAQADTYTGQTYNDIYGTGSMDYSPWTDWSTAGVDYTPSDYYDFSVA